MLLLKSSNFNKLEQSTDKKISSKRSEGNKEIIKRVVDRLYYPKKTIDHIKDHKHNQTDLGPSIRKINHEIQISKVATSARQNRISNLSYNLKENNPSKSLQSYNFTLEGNNDEADTVIPTENEDRYVRKDNFLEKKK